MKCKKIKTKHKNTKMDAFRLYGAAVARLLDTEKVLCSIHSIITQITI